MRNGREGPLGNLRPYVRFDEGHVDGNEIELQKDRSKRAIRRQNKKRFDKREDEY